MEVVVTGHDEWWLCLLNRLGANMTWTHALLRFGDYIIEAGSEGVVKKDWDPTGYKRYARFRPIIMNEMFEARMHSFALGEVGKRYKWEVLPIILLRILQRLPILRRTPRNGPGALPVA